MIIRNSIQEKVIEYYTVESERFVITIDKGSQQLYKFIIDNQGASLSGAQIIFLEKRMGVPSTITKKL